MRMWFVSWIIDSEITRFNIILFKTIFSKKIAWNPDLFEQKKTFIG